MIKAIKKKIHLVKGKDMAAFLLFPLFLPYALVLKISGRKIFLIAERRGEARDNGLAFFLYCMQHATEYECYYVMDLNAPEYEKVKAYASKVIQFGSIRHWAYYIASKANISSQKNAAPTVLAGAVFRKLGLMNDKVMYLKHGIIKDNAAWHHYDHTRFGLICCGARPEYEFIRDNFGYPADHVCYTGGLCRYDRLHHVKKADDAYILVMPTWREWLNPQSLMMKEIEHTDVFEETQYFKTWYGLLNNQYLEELSSRYHFKVRFYLHPMLKKLTDHFKSTLPSVTICADTEWNLQELLSGASMLITDYSSVYFDMVYMKRPVAFYQFDVDKFRKNQYPEGYFKYSDNPFGESTDSEKRLLELIENTAVAGFEVSEKYLAGHRQYFPLWDDRNCKRTFEAICKKISD